MLVLLLLKHGAIATRTQRATKIETSANVDVAMVVVEMRRHRHLHTPCNNQTNLNRNGDVFQFHSDCYSFNRSGRKGQAICSPIDDQDGVKLLVDSSCPNRSYVLKRKTKWFYYVFIKRSPRYECFFDGYLYLNLLSLRFKTMLFNTLLVSTLPFDFLTCDYNGKAKPFIFHFVATPVLVETLFFQDGRVNKMKKYIAVVFH
jgi:hypothetical protein